MIRAYEAQGVDEKHRDNTYMEIFSAKDPFKLEILNFVDRTFIHANTLSITDLKVYMDDIYFIDVINGLYRLDFQKNQQIRITGRYDEEGFFKFSVFSNSLKN